MAPKLPLPRGWKRRVRSPVPHILALSHYTFAALLARAERHGPQDVCLEVKVLGGLGSVR